MNTPTITPTKTHAKAVQIIAIAPKTISEMLDDGKFYEWQSEQIDSGGYSRNTDKRDRYNRCYDASEYGGDGSTHAEHIEDFREYGNHVYGELNRELFKCFGEDLTEAQEDELQTALDEAQESFVADCDRCEAWHQTNGSLEQQIG